MPSVVQEANVARDVSIPFFCGSIYCYSLRVLVSDLFVFCHSDNYVKINSSGKRKVSL